ncbi:hypothetical protein [Clostridium sp. JNZ J1-5]
MEYLNHNFGFKRNIKAALISVAVFLFIIFILQGIAILIPVSIGIWGIFKGVNFIKSKFAKFKKVNSKIENFQVYEYNVKNDSDVYNSEIIDVEYEEVNK